MSAKRNIIPLFVPHAGCKHSCVFCDQVKITGKSSSASINDVTQVVSKTLNAACRESAVEIAFFGGSFTAIPINQQNALLDAVQPMLVGNNSIRLSTRPDCFTNDDAKRLRSYGVRTIEFGVQSMCDDVLSASQRGHTSKDVIAAVEVAIRNGFDIVLQMMTGLPDDTYQKSVYTAKSLVDLSPHAVRIYPAVVVKDTILYKMWQNGQYKEHSLDEAIEVCSEICKIFWAAKIPIIRLGLNPTKEFAMGAAVAGAYHPAFGELVYSNIFYQKAVKLLSENEVAAGSNVCFIVPQGKTSAMTGHCRKNVIALRKGFSLASIKVLENDIDFNEMYFYLT